MANPDQSTSVAPFPVNTIRLGILAMLVLLAFSNWLTWRVGEQLRGVVDSQIEVLTAAHRVDHYGTILEMSVKAVVNHNDEAAAAKYKTVQPQLRDTLTSLRRQVEETPDRITAEAVDRADLALIEMEYRALDLASQGRLGEARELIHSPRYNYLVDAYYAGIRSIEKRASAYIESTQRKLDIYLWIILAISVASMGLIVLGWFILIRPARRWGRELDKARAEAERAAGQLRESKAELEQLNERLFTQARRDTLTGLNTRLAFNEEVGPIVEAARAGKGHASVVMCDIDFFKQYNDRFGHLSGDRALRQVAKTLQANVREGERVYRFGGEEFVVVLDDCELEFARQRAEQLRRAVEALDIPHSDSALGRVTISMGVSEIGPAGPGTVEEWLAEADRALYRAKEQGRNRVRALAA
jgi:diguanylate cyclase (GGDEF)-like protein